jgi:hypothetical protein
MGHFEIPPAFSEEMADFIQPDEMAIDIDDITQFLEIKRESLDVINVTVNRVIQ